MKRRIDPKIDCIFKALLGSIENRNLPTHFLDDKLGIVDIAIVNPIPNTSSMQARMRLKSAPR